MSQPTILGSFEVVSLPELGLYDVIAKVDTGAFSGAVHCVDIKLTTKQSSSKPTLCFVPAGITKLAYETTNFTKRRVRSSTGHQVERYVIQTKLTIKGVTHDIEIGLSDRSDMKRQVLIGRRFLRENRMLVDVARNAEYDDEGDVLS